MTPEAQRIAIAEACGWTRRREHAMSQWIAPHGGSWNEPPDYLNDLNAMQSAEKLLKSAEQFRQYADSLDDGNGGHFATAAQRAEAFLKTLNLWTP